jgi:hypothetical protein
MSYEPPTVEAYGTVESHTHQVENPGFSVPLEYEL